MNDAQYEIIWQSEEREIKSGGYANTPFTLAAIFSNFSSRMKAGDTLLIKKVRDDE